MRQIILKFLSGFIIIQCNLAVLLPKLDNQNIQQAKADVCTKFICIEEDGKKLHCVHEQKETKIVRDLNRVLKNIRNGKDQLSDLKHLSQELDTSQDEEIYFFIKCFTLISEIRNQNEMQHFISIVSNILHKNITGEHLRVIYKKFVEVLNKTYFSDFSVISEGVVVSVLYPFKAHKYYGLGLDRNSVNNRYQIRYMETNRVDDDTLIAGYVPPDFLNDLIDRNEIKPEIQMVIILDDAFKRFFDIKSELGEHFIGVRIPNFCKKNKLAMFEAYFKRESRWVGYGQSYYDSITHNRSGCILNDFSFFGVDRYESVADKFCIFRQTPIVNSRTIEFDAVQIGKKSYPRSFCLDRDLNIPSLDCTASNIDSAVMKRIECFDYRRSAITDELYRKAIDCVTESICDPRLDENSSWNYVDYRLKMLATKKSPILLKHHRKNLDNAVQSIITEKRSVTNLLNLLDVELIHSPNDDSLNDSNIVFYTFKPDAIGFYIYTGDNRIHLGKITRDNYEGVVSKAPNSNLEMMIYLNRTDWDLTEKIATKFFVFRRKNLPVNDDSTTKSYSVAVLQDSAGLNFHVYLKSGDKILRPLHDNTTGFNFNLDRKYWKSMMFISGLKNDECGSSYTINVFNKGGGLQLITSETVKLYLLDAIIQPLFNINPIYKHRYDADHIQYLHLIQFTGAGLSLFGMASITITALALKKWYSKRFCIVQLAIALSYQALFSLLNPLILHQLCYLLLYYSILSQFFWMLLLGVIQYLKFVKMRRNANIGVKKSFFIGWVIPAIIILTSLIADPNCIKCSSCIKHAASLFYFIQIPIILIITFNLIVYTSVMLRICRHKQRNKFARTNKFKTALILPFTLGFYWICWYLLLIRVFWVNVVVWYFVHAFVPTQGFLVFLILVVLDDETKLRWRKRFEGVPVDAEKNIGSIISYGTERSTYKSTADLEF